MGFCWHTDGTTCPNCRPNDARPKEPVVDSGWLPPQSGNADLAEKELRLIKATLAQWIAFLDAKIEERRKWNKVRRIGVGSWLWMRSVLASCRDGKAPTACECGRLITKRGA